jgi:hypothetical protein
LFFCGGARVVVIKPNSIKLSALAGVFFGFCFFLLVLGVFRNLDLAIRVGVPSTSLFSISIFLILKKVFNFNKEVPSDLKSEILIASGPANHYAGVEVRGGWLYLSHQALTFKSHNMNIQNAESKIFLSDIQHLENFNQFGIFRTGLIVNLKSGAKEKFILNERSLWRIEFKKINL